jgi:hypothetical protein
MSCLINNELIWICTPKCASHSVENALKNSNLETNFYYSQIHAHIPIKQSFNRFGKKETICITRNWVSKWLSALDYIWARLSLFPQYSQPLIEWEEVNNDFIYNTFDDNFINELHNINPQNISNCYGKLIKNETPSSITDNDYVLKKGIITTLISNKYWTNNQKCTYEFDIKELDKFVDFIEERFGERLIIDTFNKSSHKPNNIIIDDELKQWIWDKFENRFEKRNLLI